ncbi:long-chain fatty acid transport protein [Rhizobium tibeticum]|uniref:Long-chain fatty acid transport protein n=1 Tax=Rhizobium tibeticum TaxID=501024 RepID=A0A1H8M6V2_9HYPH|nr:OmpP1/FadL family transporter [Rhizobium tibeticum]SEH93861.1 Outer membrane flp protein [Rhizobium tibeticum]SEO12980.1 long-chain fatty acid transport protein [Rhizobium tibeticum]
MASRMISAGVLSLALFSTLAQPSFAGGLDRSGYNIDLLFDQSRFSAQSAVIYVMPQRELKNVRDTNTSVLTGGGNLNGRSHSADDTANYAIPYVGFKAGYEDVDCLFDYSEPFGAHTNPGINWAGANNNIETKIETHNYATTCSYKFDVGPGQLRLIGGVFYQEVEGFKERLVSTLPIAMGTGTGVGRLDLEDNGWGWRAGLGYEIPEYAMRASLVYNSRVKYDSLSGTVDLTQVPVVPGFGGRVTSVFGEAEAPDSLELKVQSGIAPDWLAFGSVKWTNWSVLQSIPLCPVSTKGRACTSSSLTKLTSLDLLYQDGWTITGGVGHKFNDQWTGAVSLTWDRGTSHGYGAQTDTWTVGLGAAYNPTDNIEWRVAGALGILTSGSSGVLVEDGVTYGNDVSYDFGNDLVAAVSTSIKVKF